jgi:phage terminase small subunit
MKSKKKLTPRQAKFVRGYATGKSATQAAKDAGYAETYANRFAAKLVVNPLVISALDAFNDKLTVSSIADAKERREFWTETIRNQTESMRDRLRASELLGKSQGDFIERRELSGPNGGPIEFLEVDPAKLSNEELDQYITALDTMAALAKRASAIASDGAGGIREGPPQAAVDSATRSANSSVS